MSDRAEDRRLWGVIAGALVLAVALPVAGLASGGRAAKCGKVVLNEQAWAGSTANTYVAKAVLEKNLGCTVSITKITEIPVYQAMADGKVDAVLEDWQHVVQYKQYVTKQKTVILVGSNGLRAISAGSSRSTCSSSTRSSRRGKASRARRACSRAPRRARKACSSAATRPTCRRTRS